MWQNFPSLGLANHWHTCVTNYRHRRHKSLRHTFPSCDIILHNGFLAFKYNNWYLSALGKQVFWTWRTEFKTRTCASLLTYKTVGNWFFLCFSCRGRNKVISRAYGIALDSLGFMTRVLEKEKDINPRNGNVRDSWKFYIEEFWEFQFFVEKFCEISIFFLIFSLLFFY